jgi:LysR family hca operon transcriptional activator
MYPGVQLRLYRYVAVLAEELNFTRAALCLHVAQPSLSKQIRQLEAYLGAQLFERTKRDVRLTAAGEAFTAEARLTLFHADRAVQGARAGRDSTAAPGASAIRR